MTDTQLSLRLTGHGSDPDPEPPEAREAREAPPAPAPAPAPAAAVTLHGGRMPIRSQAGAAAGHAFRSARARAREMAKRPGGPVNALLEAKPESVAEHRAYARSRAWVPPAHSGRFPDSRDRDREAVVGRLGAAYHLLIGTPGVALGNSISGIAARPLRFLLVVLVLGVATLVVAVALALS